MAVISYSSLRQNLRKIMDTVIMDRKTYEVTRAGQDPVVMLSKQDYDALNETLYLLSNPVNADRLFESIEQASTGNLLYNELSND